MSYSAAINSPVLFALSIGSRSRGRRAWSGSGSRSPDPRRRSVYFLTDLVRRKRAVPSAVKLRDDYSAVELRALANRSPSAPRGDACTHRPRTWADATPSLTLDIVAAATSSAGALLPPFWLKAMITSATITETTPPPPRMPRMTCSLAALGNSTESVRITDKVRSDVGKPNTCPSVRVIVQPVAMRGDWLRSSRNRRGGMFFMRHQDATRPSL